MYLSSAGPDSHGPKEQIHHGPIPQIHSCRRQHRHPCRSHSRIHGCSRGGMRPRRSGRRGASDRSSPASVSRRNSPDAGRNSSPRWRSAYGRHLRSGQVAISRADTRGVLSAGSRGRASLAAPSLARSTQRARYGLAGFGALGLLVWVVMAPAATGRDAASRDRDGFWKLLSSRERCAVLRSACPSHYPQGQHTVGKEMSHHV